MVFLSFIIVIVCVTLGYVSRATHASPSLPAVSGNQIVAQAQIIENGKGQAINGWPGNEIVHYRLGTGHNPSSPGPNAGSGSCLPGQSCTVDCSGFTRWVYYLAYHNNDVLNAGGNSSTGAQKKILTRVPDASASPGDLVFFPGSPGHVGIYIGNGEMIHASQGANRIKTQLIKYVGKPSGYYRYIPQLTSIAGEFLSNPGNQGVFDATQPVIFTQSFSSINFNPDPSYQNCLPSTGVNQDYRPFTDVYPPANPNGGPCQIVAAQNSGGTEQAGNNDLYQFQAAFTGFITIPSAGTMTSYITADDGFIFSVGPSGSNQPTAGPNNPMNNAPSVSPIKGYTVIAANNQPAAPTALTIVTTFPSAGTYPVELDYTECCGGALTLVLNNNFTP